MLSKLRPTWSRRAMSPSVWDGDMCALWHGGERGPGSVAADMAPHPPGPADRTVGTGKLDPLAGNHTTIKRGDGEKQVEMMWFAMSACGDPKCGSCNACSCSYCGDHMDETAPWVSDFAWRAWRPFSFEFSSHPSRPVNR